MTPKALAPERRAAFLGLVALALCEAGALVGGALALKAAIDAATGGGVASAAPPWPLLGMLGASAAAAMGLAWARLTAAEDFGMRFANAARLGLARHAVAMAAGGRKRRLGAMAVRMTGDLTALRDWVALGVSDLCAAGAAALAGLVILGVAAGPGGLGVALCVASVHGLIVAFTWRSLRKSLADLRMERGRVSALAGDIVLAAPAIARFDAEKREIARLDRRGERLRAAAVRRRALAALMAAPAVGAMALGGLLAVLAPGIGLPGPSTGAEWAAFAFGLGFLAASLGGFARAADAYLAFAVADGRMRALEVQMIAATAAPAAPKTENPRFKRGELTIVARASVAEACAAVEAMADPVDLGPLTARQRARLYPVSSPAIPLLRASVRRNLSLRRPDTDDAALRAALEAVGLSPAAWPLDRLLDPALDDPDPWTQARLRLARAIAHRPKVIFLAEPALMMDRDYPALVERVLAASGAAIVAASVEPSV